MLIQFTNLDAWERFFYSFLILFPIVWLVLKAGDYFILPTREYRHNWKRSLYSTEERKS